MIEAPLHRINCGYRQEGLGKLLSNLMAYGFYLDGVWCGSIEGFLQSVKLISSEAQKEMAALVGFKAWKIGQDGNAWKEDQCLYWQGENFERNSRAYHELLERAYDACFEQNLEFRQALLDTGSAILFHDVGKHDISDSVLTEWEYIYNLYRLRSRANQEDTNAQVSADLGMDDRAP